MFHVCNDPDLMRELEREWRAFRETAKDGAARIERRLELDLGGTWRDRRFDDYRERFSRDIGALLRGVDDSVVLETVAAHLRVRLDEYLGDGNASTASANGSKGGEVGDFLADVAREVLKRLLVRGTVNAILHWFRTDPFFAQGLAELLKYLCTAEVARQILLLLVLRELLLASADPGANAFPPASIPEASRVVSQLLSSSDARVRSMSAELLGRMRGGDAGRLAVLTRDPVPEVAGAAARALGSVEKPTADTVAALRNATASEHGSVRTAAIQALAALRTSDADAVLQGFVSHADITTRQQANDALVERESERAIGRTFEVIHRIRASSSTPAKESARDVERAARASRLMAAVSSPATGEPRSLAEPLLAMLSDGATPASVTAARAVVDDIVKNNATPQGVPWKPLPRVERQTGFAASFSSSPVKQPEPFDERQLTARNPAVRAVSGGAAAIRARAQESPAQAVTLARNAVLAAREANDRGLYALSLAILADALSRAGALNEALDIYASAGEAMTSRSVAERQQWEGTPISLAIACGRASVYARTLPLGAAGMIADLLCELFLALLRVLSAGIVLASTLAGVLIQWAIDDLCGTYAAAERSAREA